MRLCNVWLNGKNVGTLQIREADGRALIQCNLPSGWIYRAKLFAGDSISMYFGVLLPENGYFTTTAFVAMQYISSEQLHCEILRTNPGGRIPDENWLTFQQSDLWDESAFTLKDIFFDLAKAKSGTRYCIFCNRRYLLFPMIFDNVDPLVTLYAVGMPICWPEGWFLCVEIDDLGKIIF